MDLVSRFSTVHVVHTATVSDAVIGFEVCWVSHFGHPESIDGDRAFEEGDYKSYMNERDISFRPVPRGRHSENMMESRHNVVRSTYLRLKEDTGDNHNATLASYRAITISNDLYGNDTLSAFEMAKGFTKPVMLKTTRVSIPEEVAMAQDKLKASRKLALIHKSKAAKELPIAMGDVVAIYQKTA